MEEKNELEKVKEVFEKWRETKVGGQSIPEELLEKAASLLKKHTISKVTQALRISGQRLSLYVRSIKGQNTQDSQVKTHNPSNNRNNKVEHFMTLNAQSLSVVNSRKE